MSETEKKKGYSHPHGGHRSRHKERFRRESIENFREHEILELLLFYSIPQKDTNELAHSLISHFDGLKQVFAADYEKLIACPGISEHSATLIKLVWEICDWREKQMLVKDLDGNDTEAVGAYFSRWFRARQNESVAAIFLDARGQKIGNVVELVQGSLRHVTIPTDKIMEELAKRHAASFILAHNHPDGLLQPSRVDIDTTARLYRIFGDLGKPLKEHYLVTDEGYLPLVTYFQDNLLLQ